MEITILYKCKMNNEMSAFSQSYCYFVFICNQLSWQGVARPSCMKIR